MIIVLGSDVLNYIIYIVEIVPRTLGKIYNSFVHLRRRRREKRLAAFWYFVKHTGLLPEHKIILELIRNTRNFTAQISMTALIVMVDKEYLQAYANRTNICIALNDFVRCGVIKYREPCDVTISFAPSFGVTLNKSRIWKKICKATSL